MNVTLVTMVYPHPRRGFWPGFERQLGDLAAALRDAGVTVNVITSFRNGGAAHEVHEEIRIFRVSDTGHVFGKAGCILSLHVQSFGANAVKLEDVFAASDVVESFIPLPPAPVLERPGLSLFGFFAHRERVDRLHEILLHPSRFQMDRAFYHRVKAVIVGSTESGRVLMNEYGVPESKVWLVPHAVSRRFERAAAARAATRRSSSFALTHGGPLRLLYVGPLIRRKGLRTLLQAIRTVRAEYDHFHLALVGDGPERGTLKSLARRYGISDCVTFAGFVSDDELERHYGEADVFIFPSLVEGFGIVLAEAMAFGLPVVASDVPPIPEVVGPGALYVKPEDPVSLASAIARLLTDPPLRAELGNESVRRVNERFTWDRVVARTLEVFRETST